MDHVFPASWYPDSTPATVQRWTVPSCEKCNAELGKMERDLLLRLAFCVDPKSEAALGLASRVLRSLGVGADHLTDDEKTHRANIMARLNLELLPHENLAGKPGKIPGLGPTDDRAVKWSVPIPWAGLAIIAEKIVRGCEYKLKRRLIENPFEINTIVADSDKIPEPFADAITTYDFGPGCKIRRVFATEDSLVVIYFISIWGVLNLSVLVDRVGASQRSHTSTVEGFRADELRKSMSVSDYLRNKI